MNWNVTTVSKTIPKHVTLVAATKYFNPTEMRKLYNLGIRHFGENRVKDMQKKQHALDDLDITWHFIGTVQTKKVKKMIHSIDYLHSLDRVKLAKEIEKRRDTPLRCFIEVNISNEPSKHGLDPNNVIEFVQTVKDFSKIELIGLMGMATHTDDETLIHKQFTILQTLQNEIQETCNIDLKELSMGMSNDYLIALQHDATFIRLGSVLFKREV